jgi:hypothetical protein
MTKLAHRSLPPLKDLEALFLLDPSSPSGLRWKTGKRKDRVAGYLQTDGYWRVKLTHDGKYLRFPVHRIVYAIFYGLDPAQDSVDHINGRQDNNPANLRLAGKFGNQQNAGKRRKNGSSCYKGVFSTKNGKRWQASIRANGTHHYLGVFDSEEEAALAYNNACIRLHGQFAVLNRFIATVTSSEA